MRGQQFFFQAADGKNLAAQRDLAGHGQIASNRNLAQRAGNGGGDRDARRRAIFRNGAFGNVHVQIEVAVEVAAQAEALRARAYIRHRSLRGFLHDVAEFAGQRQLAFAVDDAGFGAENGAADFCPCQARDQSDFGLFVGQGVAELDDAEEVVDVLAGNGDVIVLAFFDDLARDLAADVADFAFQIADAGFARVGADRVR